MLHLQSSNISIIYTNNLDQIYHVKYKHPSKTEMNKEIHIDSVGCSYQGFFVCFFLLNHDFIMMFRKRVYTGTVTYWLGISWNSCLTLTTQLFSTFCLQSQVKKKWISRWPQNSVCKNSSYLWILLDLNLDVDITTNIYIDLHNPNKWKLILRNKNTAFTSFKSSFLSSSQPLQQQ